MLTCYLPILWYSYPVRTNENITVQEVIVLLKNAMFILMLLFMTYLFTLVATHSISEFSLILVCRYITDMFKTNSVEPTSNQKL